MSVLCPPVSRSSTTASAAATAPAGSHTWKSGAKTPASALIAHGRRAQQSRKVPALVKALLAQGPFGHMPLRDKFSCAYQGRQSHWNVCRRNKRPFHPGKKLSEFNIFEPKSPLSNLVEVGWQGPALLSKAGQEGRGTEQGKGQLHNLCFQRKTGWPKKPQTTPKKPTQPTNQKNPTPNKKTLQPCSSRVLLQAGQDLPEVSFILMHSTRVNSFSSPSSQSEITVNFAHS